MAELLQYTQEWHQQQQDIHPSDYIEETAEHNEIAELSSSLLALFKEVVLVLSRQTGIPRDARISIERSCSALILWSDGFGITQGRLNDTFNKSRKLRYTTLKNLVHIGRVLIERLVPAVDISSEKLQALCSSAELNIEAAAGLVTEESCRQSDDSSSDAASNFSDDDIYEIAEDLKTDTLVLSSLDPLLKYPIFDSQHEHIIESHALSTWGPEKSYSDKIGNRFPRADVSLTLYLGRANYERFLRCQEAREYQEEEEPLPIVNQEAGTHAGTIISNTKFHDSGVGTSIGLTMSYAETTMSYNHDGQSVRIPPLPKEAKAGSPFTCIACGRTVIITNNSAWKQHIYLDLQPYMCLDLSCPYSSSTFESRDKWISHLALDHEMEPKWASAECPLCREETGNGKIAITKHLSKHLEEVSLSALPVEVDSDAESENSSESNDAGSSLNEGAFGDIDENGETLSVEFETELASKVFSNLVDKLKAEGDHKAQSEAKGGALQQAADILAASEAENMAAQLKRTQENIEEMFRKKEGTSKMAKLLSPIKFTDAVGRRFKFPVHLCYTWQEMEDLIKQAFSQVDILGPRVQAGHYDLTGPDGKIILPSLWEETVEPGLNITMTMWPLDKAPLAGLGPKKSEQPHEEEGNREKDNPSENNISSKQQHSENVQGARIIRMSGQNFFNTVKTYFKDQPDKFTRFRVILADITTTEWVPEAWQRSCFECRVAEGIVNIGRLCGGYPSFMHDLNSIMPSGYRVEIIDASTVRFFAPDNEPAILQVSMARHDTAGLGNEAGLGMGSSEQDKSMSEASNRPTFADQNSSEAVVAHQEEISHYFAQTKQSSRTSDHAVIDTKDTPELASAELNKTAKIDVDKFDTLIYEVPLDMSQQLLKVILDIKYSTFSPENAYLVVNELFGSNSELMDEFQVFIAKRAFKFEEDVMQRFRSVSNYITEVSRAKGDKVRVQEAVATVGEKSGLDDSNEPQYCLCNRGSVGIMIRCDNVDGCKYKWFHLECVGLTVAPSSKDKWYCPDCRGDANIGEQADIDPRAFPPDSTNPEFAMDTDVSTGESNTDLLFGTQANLGYLEGLAKFHKQQGNNLNRLPYVDKKPVDLYRLKNLVESRGGFDKVCESKEWAEIAKDFGYSGRIMSSLSTSLKNSFLRWLSPYEEYLRAAKPGDDHQFEEQHVEPRNKGKEIPSIGRINYGSPNPDIYIWPPEPKILGEKENEPTVSSTAPPPLPPPELEATDPFTDHPELSSPSSDRRGISDGEHPSHEPFLARPRPDIYTKQFPPLPGVSEGSNSAQVDSLAKISNSQASPTRSSSPSASESSFGSGDGSLPSEAEPSGDGIGFQQFESNEVLTLQDERPEKCPVKTHLTAVHGVKQTPPNSRRRTSGAVALKTFADYVPDPTGKCSICSQTFINAQDFYEHLDDCVLRDVHLKVLFIQGI
ncbi:hypothetical protein J3E69DRAFT_376180 [Trichoderma sp. SZMC 28015]